MLVCVSVSVGRARFHESTAAGPKASPALAFRRNAPVLHARLQQLLDALLHPLPRDVGHAGLRLSGLGIIDDGHGLCAWAGVEMTMPRLPGKPRPGRCEQRRLLRAVGYGESSCDAYLGRGRPIPCAIITRNAFSEAPAWMGKRAGAASRYFHRLRAAKLGAIRGRQTQQFSNQPFSRLQTTLFLSLRPPLP